jgi:glucose/mannose transport system substrate-binding protein
MPSRQAAFAGNMSLALVGVAAAETKTNMLHRWSQGSDAAATAKLGEMFPAADGKWEQTSIESDTANMLAKPRADVVGGSAPPAAQPKGRETADWNTTGMT